MAGQKSKRRRVGSDEPIVIRDTTTLSRMNYLLVIAREMCVEAVKARANSDSRTTLYLVHLSRQYIKGLRGLAAKMTIPMTTDVKRSFCKRCSMFMMAGLTCDMDFATDRNALTFITRVCYGCGLSKRWLVREPNVHKFPANDTARPSVGLPWRTSQ